LQVVADGATLHAVARTIKAAARRSVTLEELIDASAVIVPLRARNVDAAIVELADALARAYGVDNLAAHEELRKREQIGSTAVGEGIAIPHARADIQRTIAAFAISREGIEWDAPDHEPVHLVVALLSPQQGSEHLVALANVARSLIDPKLRARLLAAADAREAHMLLLAPR
jgi:PTS system nitrogen regulatory IIA component